MRTRPVLTLNAQQWACLAAHRGSIAQWPCVTIVHDMLCETSLEPPAVPSISWIPRWILGLQRLPVTLTNVGIKMARHRRPSDCPVSKCLCLTGVGQPSSLLTIIKVGGGGDSVTEIPLMDDSQARMGKIESRVER